MRLVTYESNSSWCAGIQVDDKVVDALVAAKTAGINFEDSMHSTRAIIQLSQAEQSQLGKAAQELAKSNGMEDVFLGPPVPDPDKIICLGLNYKNHAEEAELQLPEVPMLFAKFRNALIGPTGTIILPEQSKEIDYEGELAVVIGRQCKNVSRENALDYVAGYMAFHDVSARDLQFRTSQFLSGKTLDTFAPCGPSLVINEIDDPQNLNIKTRVNGKTLQDGNTKDMIFPIAETIVYISHLMTLEPGDIMATGTPGGVGFKRPSPIFLQDGDVVEVEVEKIGTLRNPVVKR